MKRFDIKAEKTINGNLFLVRPFGAFTAANISGELLAVLTPVLASVLPLFSGEMQKESSVMDISLENAAPALSSAMNAVSGDKLEPLLKKLLTTHNNVSVQLEGEKEVQPLSEDIADELFCGEMQDMFVLAWEVIKVNFSGFFKNFAGSQFGSLLAGLQEKASSTSEDTESSTAESSQT